MSHFGKVLDPVMNENGASNDTGPWEDFGYEE